MSNARKGQALLLVTLSLFAMCGLLGLAVDLGWSYFVKKSAQNAADSAVLAAAYVAVSAVGETTPFPATYNHSLSPCSEGGPDELSKGCQYASQKPLGSTDGLGFSSGGDGGRQNVTIESGANSTPTDCTLPSPTAPCIAADYWVTVRTVETIPQLFSAVLGNATGISSARATAAAVQTIVNGSLITLNRKFDTGPNSTTGIDVATQPINAPAGIVVASDLAGTVPTSGVTGSVIARSPVVNPGLSDGPVFLDPLRGFGQPPLPTPKAGAHACNLSDSGPECVYAVAGGVLNNTICYNGTTFSQGGQNIVLPSGTYYPAQLSPQQCLGASTPIPLGSLSIAAGASVTFADGTFGSYLFFGGLSVSGQMKMDPGEYVVVGGQSLQVSGGNAGIANTGDAGAGEIIILTGSSSAFTSNSDNSAVTGNLNNDLYPGLMNLINGPNNANSLSLVTMALKGWLAFGPASVQTSLGSVTSAYPSSLNPSALSSLSAPYPANLQPFGGIVLWQDQANSTLQYAADGNVALCGGSINNPACAPKNPSTPNSPQLTLPGAALGLTGTIYQPRGAWINISGGSALSGSLQIITGAVAGGSINILQPPAIPLRRRIVALIE